MKAVSGSTLLKPDRFVAWLKKQSPRKSYRYVDNYDCILCRYFRAHGHENVQAGGINISSNLGTFQIPNSISKAIETKSGVDNRLYGTVLKRMNAR